VSARSSPAWAYRRSRRRRLEGLWSHSDGEHVHVGQRRTRGLGRQAQWLPTSCMVSRDSGTVRSPSAWPGARATPVRSGPGTGRTGPACPPPILVSQPTDLLCFQLNWSLFFPRSVSDSCRGVLSVNSVVLHRTFAAVNGGRPSFTGKKCQQVGHRSPGIGSHLNTMFLH